MARNKDRDQVWDIFREFGNLLTSPHWSAYVLDDQGRSAAHLYDRQARIALFAGDGAAGSSPHPWRGGQRRRSDGRQDRRAQGVHGR